MTINDQVTAWHEGDSELSLGEYLLLAGPGEIVDAHNTIRIKEGLQPLMFNPTLHRASLEWALHLSETRVCNHGQGPTMFNVRLRTAGYEGGVVGENAAVGQRSLSEVMSDWMNSDGHRAAILNPSYKEIGGSGVQLDNSTPGWCVCFGGG